MKNTRRFIAGLSAMAMAAAMAMSASAEANTKTLNKANPSGSTEVKYNAAAAYTVTIPTSVTLSDSKDVTDSVSASDVRLEKGKKIVVSLDNSNDFKVKNGDETITYNVYKGTTTDAANKLAAGSTVTEFTADNLETETLTFAKINKADVKYAGDYTGSLTFNIAVEAAVKTLTLTGQYFDNGFVTKSLEIEYTDNDTWKDIAERYDEVSIQDNIYGPEGKVVKFWCDRSKYIDGCELKSSESSYNYSLVSINDKVSAYSSYFLQ